MCARKRVGARAPGGRPGTGGGASVAGARGRAGPREGACEVYTPLAVVEASSVRPSLASSPPCLWVPHSGVAGPSDGLPNAQAPEGPSWRVACETRLWGIFYRQALPCQPCGLFTLISGYWSHSQKGKLSPHVRSRGSAPAPPAPGGAPLRGYKQEGPQLLPDHGALAPSRPRIWEPRIPNPGF